MHASCLACFSGASARLIAEIFAWFLCFVPGLLHGIHIKKKKKVQLILPLVSISRTKKYHFSYKIFTEEKESDKMILGECKATQTKQRQTPLV